MDIYYECASLPAPFITGCDTSPSKTDNQISWFSTNNADAGTYFISVKGSILRLNFDPWFLDF